MTGDPAAAVRRRPLVVVTALIVAATLVLTSAWLLVASVREDCVAPLPTRAGTSGVIVKFRAGASPLTDADALTGVLESVGCRTGVELSVERPLAISGALLLRTDGELTGREMLLVVRAFTAEEDVEYATPDEVVQPVG